METSIATTTKPDELSEFDRLILSGIEQAQSQAEPKGTPRGEKLAVLTLFVLGGILFFVGFFTVPWPLESFGFAFLIGFSALLWGSMFLISERLRWETLTADVVVLSWAYVPLAWFIPTVVIPSLELSEGGPWGPLFEYAPLIWGGASALLAVLISAAAIKQAVADRR